MKEFKKRNIYENVKISVRGVTAFIFGGLLLLATVFVVAIIGSF